VARGWNTGKGRINFREESTQVSLFTVQLGGEIADVGDFDFFGFDPGGD